MKSSTSCWAAWTIAQGGVLPNIQAVLLPKKRRATTRPRASEAAEAGRKRSCSQGLLTPKALYRATHSVWKEPYWPRAFRSAFLWWIPSKAGLAGNRTRDMIWVLIGAQWAVCSFAAGMTFSLNLYLKVMEFNPTLTLKTLLLSVIKLLWLREVITVTFRRQVRTVFLIQEKSIHWIGIESNLRRKSAIWGSDR